MIRDLVQPTESLPLFSDLAQEAPSLTPGEVRPQAPVADRHLAAARRLAKAMRRLPDHSVEQTRAGQAICRHLIALLEESAGTSADR